MILKPYSMMVKDICIKINTDQYFEPIRPHIEAKLGEIVDILIVKGEKRELIEKKLRKALVNADNAIFLDIVLDNILDKKCISLSDIENIAEAIKNV